MPITCIMKGYRSSYVFLTQAHRYYSLPCCPSVILSIYSTYNNYTQMLNTHVRTDLSHWLFCVVQFFSVLIRNLNTFTKWNQEIARMMFLVVHPFIFSQFAYFTQVSAIQVFTKILKSVWKGNVFQNIHAFVWVVSCPSGELPVSPLVLSIILESW